MHNGYGARTLARRHARLTHERWLRIPEIIWSHGWQPLPSNFDVDRIVGESGETSYLQDCTYLVARIDQEEVLKKSGITNVFAIGLPFSYALKNSSVQPVRKPSSLLVIPAWHGHRESEEQNHIDADYLSFIDASVGDFETVEVMLNCDDFRNLRNKEWEARGYTVRLGGCEDDSESLDRLVGIFLKPRFQKAHTLSDNP